MFKSVFLLISAIATSKALWRKFAQTGKGASWMTFPATSFTDSGFCDTLECQFRFVRLFELKISVAWQPGPTAREIECSKLVDMVAEASRVDDVPSDFSRLSTGQYEEADRRRQLSLMLERGPRLPLAFILP